MVGSLMVQYEHQESGETLGVDQVEYDENWAKAEMRKSLGFWSGERAARGVDIEDAWKCESCQFRDICVWRLRQKLEASPAAKLTDL
jgi:exonuclease V